MAHRSYSVVVVPDEWDDSLEELARAMMPISRREPPQVLPLLARGPMTLEADLSVEEAGKLRARLLQLGVPARVIDGDGDIVAAAKEGLRRVRKGEDDAERGLGPSGAGARPAPGLAQGEGSGANDATTTPTGGPGAKDTPPTPADRQWEEFFSEVDVDDRKEERQKEERNDGEQKEESNDGEQEEERQKEESNDGEQEEERQKEERNDVKEQQEESQERAFKQTEKWPDARPKQPPSPGPSQPPSRGPKAPPNRFDAGRMNDALHSRGGGKPPYAPEGFDDSIEHVPALAALLSVVAPGAGQIYNGQDEDARDYALRFALIRPWVESVRQAWEYAEKIRTYWAPRPPSGALKRSLKHLAIIWVIVAPLLAGLGWVGSMVYDVASQPVAPKITQADLTSAFTQAETAVQMARIDALDSVGHYLDTRDADYERFTMSDAERAERLFRRGMEFCRAGNYTTCEDAMKRVSSLSPELRRHAFRLQGWASVQRRTGGDEPMPDVGAVESLAQYERKVAERDEAQRDDGGQLDQPESAADAGPVEPDAGASQPDADRPDAAQPAEQSPDGPRPP